MADDGEKQNRPGTFVKGHDPRRHELNPPKPAEELPPKVEVEGDGLLRAMRHVLANDKCHDRTPEEKGYRKLYQKKPDVFLARMERLIAATAGGGGRQGQPGVEPGSSSPPPADLGTDACLSLARSCLAQLARGKS